MATTTFSQHTRYTSAPASAHLDFLERQAHPVLSRLDGEQRYRERRTLSRDRILERFSRLQRWSKFANSHAHAYKFFAEYPDGQYLTKKHRMGLSVYLRNVGATLPGERVEKITRSTGGNMNMTLLVTTNQRQLFIKQARPWVEAQTEVEASAERIKMELLYYTAILQDPYLRSHSPELILFDANSSLVVFEALAQAQEMSITYHGDPLSRNEVEVLGQYLARLHNLQEEAGEWEEIEGLSLKEFNHEVIFDSPFTGNFGRDLDLVVPGLEDAAERIFRSDESYRQQVKKLGEIYLNSRDNLLHGDFFPGNWLQTEKGVVVIDAEFALIGPAEFDLGLGIGHLLISGHSWERIQDMILAYTKIRDCDLALALQFGGVEMMRRLAGVAQINDIKYDLDHRIKLLTLAKGLVMTPDNFLKHKGGGS